MKNSGSCLQLSCGARNGKCGSLKNHRGSGGLSARVLREYVGSTAIPSLLAKPTADILLETRDSMRSPTIVESLGQVSWCLFGCSLAGGVRR